MRVSAAVIAVSCAACSAPGDSPFFERLSPVGILDTTPAADAVDVAIDTDLEIEFGGDVRNAQAIEDAFTLVALPAETPVVGLVVSYDDRLARIVLPNGVDLELGSRYRASLTGLLDVRGRPLEPYQWEFTVVDPPAPALVAMLPTPASTSPGNFVVRAIFNVPLDPALLGANPLRVNAGGVGGSASYDPSSNTLTFHPNATANGGMSVTFDLAGVVDVYGRQFVPSGWAFTANDAIVDASRPTLAGNVTASETSAGTITVTYDPAIDDQWSGTGIRYEALLTKLKPPAPAGCLDPFEPESIRAAVYGTTPSGIAISGLSGGSWSVLLDAEDGSGRRSLASTGGTVTLTQGAATFVTAIQPVLEERCALSGCHVGNDPPGYVDYTDTRDEIVSHESQTGLALVTPYCLQQSYLWHKLAPGFEIDGQSMPPLSVEASALSRRDRELFRRWIVEQGGN